MLRRDRCRAGHQAAGVEGDGHPRCAGRGARGAARAGRTGRRRRAGAVAARHRGPDRRRRRGGPRRASTRSGGRCPASWPPSWPAPCAPSCSPTTPAPCGTTRRCGAPITATSARRSGWPGPAARRATRPARWRRCARCRAAPRTPPRPRCARWSPGSRGRAATRSWRRRSSRSPSGSATRIPTIWRSTTCAASRSSSRCSAPRTGGCSAAGSWPRDGSRVRPAHLLGLPLDERSLRVGMEAAYRRMAANVTLDVAQRITYVDQANRIRNWSRW